MKFLVIFLMTATIPLNGPINNNVYTDGLALPISQKSIDLIIEYECGGKEYYNKYLVKPEVPAWDSTSSGVTIGIGYDCSYYSKDQIKKDLDGIVSDEQISLLQSTSGMHGRNAYYNALPRVKYKVQITYDQAEKIFKKSTLPSFTKQTANAFALSPVRLPPSCNGVLTSLVFNRGPSMANIDSRKEMREIKINISTNKEEKVPANIKSMKRLWNPVKLKGLWLRRDAEAKLFQEGLDFKN